LHKTGTSAVQSYLAHHRDILYKAGIFYPPTHSFEAHHGLSSRLNSNRTSLEDAIKNVNRTLTTMSNMSDSDTLLLSSEMFSENVDPRSFKYLPEIFSEIDFVIYVRRQDELLESAYNQQVKQNGESRLITDYKPYLTNIYEHLKWFEDSVPNSRVKAFVYDKSHLLNANVVNDFLQKALNIDKPKLNHTNKKKLVNKSLSPIACLLMARVNELIRDKSERGLVLDYLVEELPITKFSNYKLLTDEYEENLFSSLLISNRNLDDEYLNKEYMAKLTIRNKDYLSLNVAKTIAGDLGILDKLYKEFDLVGDI